MSAPLETQPGEPTMAFDLGQLREIDAKDMAVRFAFGAAVSVAAAVISSLGNATIGGLFLAFPAILSATLTMLEKEQGTEAARHDDRGAVIGSLGMIAFAFVGAVLFVQAPIGITLAIAAFAWAAVALVIYLAVARWRHAHGRVRTRHG